MVEMGRSDANICPGCKTNVVNLDVAVQCSVCETPYCQSYAAIQTKLDSGGFSKCCGPPSRSTSTNPMQNNDLLKAINKMETSIQEEFNKQLALLKEDPYAIKTSL